MAESGQQFRSAVFGGFEKQDVLNYIESSTREHRAKVDLLQKELDEAKAVIASLEAAQADLTAKHQAAEAALDEKRIALEQTDAKLDEYHTRHDALEQENAALRAKVNTLEPDAVAYRSVKDRTASIELDAHFRAQAAETAAEERVKTAEAELKQWLVRLQSGYDRLRTDVDATLSHASGELGNVIKTLEHISTQFASQDEALGRLVDDYRGPQPPLPLDVD